MQLDLTPQPYILTLCCSDDPMLPLLDANASCLNPCSGQLSDGRWLHLPFPAVPWFVLRNSWFAQQWVSYTLSFEGVLAQWEAGNFDQTLPAGALPMGGLKATNSWSLKRGEAKQSELVGMTAVAESGAVELASYLTFVTSS